MTIITVLSSWMLSLALAFGQAGTPKADRFHMLDRARPSIGRAATVDGTSCLRCHK